jgi:hypothetical protein
MKTYPSEVDANGVPDPALSSRLRLRPGAQVFDVSAEQLQVAFANYTATFSGLPVAQGIRALLPALVSGAERAELVKGAAEQAGLEASFLEYLVDLLLRTNCLFLESKLPSGWPGREALAEFYASLGEDPNAVFSTLADGVP